MSEVRIVVKGALLAAAATASAVRCSPTAAAHVHTQHGRTQTDANAQTKAILHGRQVAERMAQCSPCSLAEAPLMQLRLRETPSLAA